MKKKVFATLILFLLLTACGMLPGIQTATFQSATNTQSLSSTITPLSPTVAVLDSSSTPSPTAQSLPTSTSTLSEPALTPTPLVQPVINRQPGELYRTVFSIPISTTAFPYTVEPGGAVTGPKAFAIMPDDTFLIGISQLGGSRLLNYDRNGQLLNTMDLAELGISVIDDLRVRGDDIYVLEYAIEGYRIHHLTLNGELISSDPIPKSFPSGNSMSPELVYGEATLAVDCDMNVLMEVARTHVYVFSEVLENADPAKLQEGYPCGGKYYRQVHTVVNAIFKINAGDATYETQLMTQFGGLIFVKVFDDGSFYVLRSDVVGKNFLTDTTIHYVDPSGTILAVARIPSSERFYYIERNADINSTGEVFVMLPREESLDVIRLNFYEELPPLLPDGIAPVVRLSP